MLDLVLLSALLVLIIVLNCYTAILTHHTRHDMSTLEKNTNSKMDAVLELTAKASRAEGEAAGLEEGRNELRKG